MKSFVCLLRGDYKGTSGEVDVRFRPVEWRPKNLYTHTTIKEKSFLEKNSFTVLYQFETKWQCAVLHTHYCSWSYYLANIKRGSIRYNHRIQDRFYLKTVKTGTVLWHRTVHNPYE